MVWHDNTKLPYLISRILKVQQTSPDKLLAPRSQAQWVGNPEPFVVPESTPEMQAWLNQRPPGWLAW